MFSVLMDEEEIALFSSIHEDVRDTYVQNRKDLLEYAHGRRRLPEKKSKSDEDHYKLYKTGKLPTSRKVKNAATLGSLGAATGALLGSTNKKALKRAAIGAVTGAGISAGIDYFGDHYAKKQLKKDPHFYDADKKYLDYKHNKATEKDLEKEIKKEYFRKLKTK